MLYLRDFGEITGALTFESHRIIIWRRGGNMKKIIIVGAAVLLAGGMIVKTLYDAGQFKTIVSHCDCSCVKISGLPGPEDITIDAAGGIAFISSDDRRAEKSGKPVQGAVFGMDIRAKDMKAVLLTADFPKKLHPHGISLYKSAAGEVLLFVINHAPEGNCVEIFEYRDKKLHHRESISHPLMFSPNDLVAVGPRSFYATNDHGNRSKWGQTLEEYLQLPFSYVVYFNGKDMGIAAKGFRYANGINVDREGRKLYVASTTGGSLHVFSRDIPTGKLTPERDISLNSGADNIEIDAGGNLFIACHPKLLAFSAHAKNRAKLSPSQVLKISFSGTDRHKIEEIYLNGGREISGSSVAAPLNGGFLVGQVFEDHILVCR